MLGRQANNEQFYIRRKDAGRGLKSLREVYEEKRLRVGCYMFVPDNRWIKEAWKQESRKECSPIKDEIILTMQTKVKTVQFEGEDMKLEGKILDREFKPIWKQVKKIFKNGSEEKQLEQYRKKEMQSEKYIKQTRQKMQYMTGTEFNAKKNISHYVDDRTNQSLEGSQRAY